MKQTPTDLLPAFFLVCALAAVLVPRGASAEDRLPYPADPDRRREGRPPRRDGRRPVPLARGRRRTRGPGLDGRRRTTSRARSSAEAPRARRARRAARRSCSTSTRSRRPHRRGAPHFYIAAARGRQEKAIVYWKEGEGAPEKVLLDPNTWCEDGSVSLGGWSPSWDGTTVAYQLQGEQLRRGDAARRRRRDRARSPTVDVIEGAKYACASWTPDGSGFYYTWLPTDPAIPSTERPGYAEVALPRARRAIRRPTRVVHPRRRPDARSSASSVSRDGRWLVPRDPARLDRRTTSTSRTWPRRQAGALDARSSTGRGRTARCSTCRLADRVLRPRPNDGAPRGRVFAVDPLRPARAAWKEIVPERQDATLAGGCRSSAGGSCCRYLRNAASELEVRDARRQARPRGGAARDRHGRRAARATPDEDEAYFSFTSFTDAARDLPRPRSRRRARRSVGRIDGPGRPVSPFVVEQVFYPVEGRHAGLDVPRPPEGPGEGRERPAPSSTATAASTSAYAGLHARRSTRGSRRGGVSPCPNLRGGGEYGEEWHRAGMLAQEAERLRRLHRRGRVAGRGGVHRARTGSRSAAARTAACSSAPR